MLDPRDVAEQLGIVPKPAVDLAAQVHAIAARDALEALKARPVESTPDLVAYAQAEATLSIALSLADIRAHLERS